MIFKRIHLLSGCINPLKYQIFRQYYCNIAITRGHQCTLFKWSSCPHLASVRFCSSTKTKAEEHREENTSSSFDEFTTSDTKERGKRQEANAEIFALTLGENTKKDREIARKVKQEGEKALGIFTPQEKNRSFQLRGGSKYDLLFCKVVVKDGLKKEAFMSAIDRFIAQDRNRRGHKEFVKKAIMYMDDFKLEKDIEAYHKILSAYPKGRFKPKRMLDALWPIPHPQMYTALDLLTKMEYNRIRPNQDTHDIIKDVFGTSSFPMQKAVRMAYWFDKFDEMFPHPYPLDLPEDEMVLSRMALDRMMGKMIGKQKGEITVYKEKTEDSESFIISSQTPLQRKKLAELSTESCVYVEGPFYIWIRKYRRCYFTIRTDIDCEPGQEEIDDEAGVLATCMTGKEDEELAKEWVDHLQKAHPHLTQCTMVFNFKPELLPPEEDDEIVVQSKEVVKEGESTEQPHEYSHI